MARKGHSPRPARIQRAFSPQMRVVSLNETRFVAISSFLSLSLSLTRNFDSITDRINFLSRSDKSFN